MLLNEVTRITWFDVGVRDTPTMDKGKEGWNMSEWLFNAQFTLVSLKLNAS